MKNDFLLEILVQELPYKFIPSAIEQLKSAFEKLLGENSLEYGDVKTYATPRRLVVVIENLAVSQKDAEKCIKGPILTIAKNDKGELTPAGIGFKNKNNAADGDLFEQDGYIWAKIQQQGVSARVILSENIESIILKLQGAHFMRWGELDVKFSRPIENVLALLNDEILDVTVVGKKSSKTTLGHRYSHNKTVEVMSPKTYFEQMKSANVIVDQNERKGLIVDLASNMATKINAEIDFDNYTELLEEITYITEFPVPVLCEFNKKYLQIPDIVTTTVMSKHQRYFPLHQGGKLLNCFITMANFVGEDPVAIKNIQNGNQRVVTARLEDGIFFYLDDCKTKLGEKLEALKGMTFQKDFGTLFDKTRRTMQISEYICNALSVPPQDILRTAELAKCDLSTSLVFEFTELQGFIGAIYAKNSGEKENVAKGILEHYYPLNATAELAGGLEGQIVGIADKIDTICAVFLATQGEKKKKRPTGSNDPLGIRRAVLGILRTIIVKKINLDLVELIKHTLKTLETEFGATQEPDLPSDIINFISSRLIVMLGTDWNKEILDACLYGALENLQKYLAKVEFLHNITGKDEFSVICENAVRIGKIITQNTTSAVVDAQKLAGNEEKALYECALRGEFKTYEQLLDLAKKVEIFFEKTMVMDENLEIRANRLTLLSTVKAKFDAIADFSKITLKK